MKKAPKICHEGLDGLLEIEWGSVRRSTCGTSLQTGEQCKTRTVLSPDDTNGDDDFIFRSFSLARLVTTKLTIKLNATAFRA